MSNQSFHRDATFMAASVLFGPKLNKTQEIDMLSAHNAYLKERVTELTEINLMQAMDLESTKFELTQSQSNVNDLNNELTAKEMNILSLHIDMCQKDIELCRLRLAVFKLNPR